jgi:2-polyprenyl-3-methyl-5-hydroxy-6-metoxy-1,4-benzoquinol methylase
MADTQQVFTIKDKEIPSEEIIKTLQERKEGHINSWGQEYLDVSGIELYLDKGMQILKRDDVESIDYNLSFVNENWDKRPKGAVLAKDFPFLGWVINEAFDIQTNFNAHVVRLLTRLNQSRVEMMSEISEIKGTPTDLPELNYIKFEEKIRGSDDWIEKNFIEYLEYFVGCGRVLDIGCGRGNFLKILKRRGIGAYGIDTDIQMVTHCQKLGLNVHKADAVWHLRYLKDGFTDGIFMAQVIEHMQPRQMLEVVRLAHAKLKPKSYFIVETINPTSLLALSHWYNMDLTHVRPVHFETLKFLFEDAGFKDITIKFKDPVPEDQKLETYNHEKLFDGKFKEYAEIMNDNIKKLNNTIYGYTDYAIIGKK